MKKAPIILITSWFAGQQSVDSFSSLPPTRALQTPSTCPRCEPMYSSRRPRPVRDSYYQDEGYFEEDGFEDEDISYYGGYDTRVGGKSREDPELKRMANNGQQKDIYYDDEEDFEEFDDFPRARRNGKMQKYRYEGEEEDLLDDEYESEDGSMAAGNFWSNPTLGSSPPNGRQPMDRDYVRRPREGAYEPRPRRRRSSIRSGGPATPKPAKDLYERLFWYGFDPSENEGVGDKTVFGGTKGKFNGLKYLQASDGVAPSRNRRQLPPPRQSEDYNDYYDEGGPYETGEYYEDRNASPKSQKPFAKPPNDTPYPRSDVVDPSRRRAERRKERQTGVYYDEDDSGDWVSRQVSSWFNGRDSNYDEDDIYDGRGQRRQQRRKSSEWSPFNLVDTFFGVDRDELEYKANVYNEKMGIGPKRRRRNGQREQRDRPRRAGYAYRYDRDKEEDDEDFVDIESSAAESALEKPSRRTADPIDTTPVADRKGGSSASSGRTKERSWEERALAVERVPPADIPAWGPSGEMQIDARTKAIMDALEDIQTASQKLEAKEKREALAREDITVLKVDAELERRKLEEARSGSRFAQERLRQIELDIDEASRALRRARTQVTIARDQLEELKERHWAVLSFYNPDQAEVKVSEALNEFQQLEPAARLDDFNGKQAMPPTGESEKVVRVQAETDTTSKPSEAQS